MDTNGSHDEQERDLDWESMRHPAATANTVTAQSGEISPEMLHQVWARRAAQLAKVTIQEDKTEQIKLVLIELGREIYGVNVQYVFDIRPAELITRVPRVPDWVAGVVNLRGRIFSVVDLRRFFGLPPAEAGDSDESEFDSGLPCLVVVETPSMEIALLVDDVLTVESLPLSQVQDVTGTVRGLRSEYVQGVVTLGSEDAAGEENRGMVVVLDLPALLADERLIVHEEIV